MVAGGIIGSAAKAKPDVIANAPVAPAVASTVRREKFCVMRVSLFA
jgi:hypothetical protein